jgi:uncharacterized coiled-coil protein SlyX
MNSMHEAVYSTIPRDVIKRLRKEETMSELHVILNRTLQQLERKNAKVAELYGRIAELETQIMEKGVEQ